MSAKSTFGTLKDSLYQGDYINKKKSQTVSCDKNAICNRLNYYDNYETRYLFNLGYYLHNSQVNHTNLVIGQYTKSNLKNVCVVSLGAPPSKYCSSINPCNPCQTTDQVPIDTSSTATSFYLGQTIDPLGELFGASQCGELNYTKYMVPNLK